MGWLYRSNGKGRSSAPTANELVGSFNRHCVVRASRPTGSWTRATCIVSLCVALLFALSGCPAKSTPAGRQALDTFESFLRGGSNANLADITRRSSDLSGLSRSMFTADDLARRDDLLRQADSRIVSLATLEIDLAARSAESESGVDATRWTWNVVAPRYQNTKFMDDLNEVTQEAIIDVGCEFILDNVAPDKRPVDPGMATDVEEAVYQAMGKMLARSWGWDFLQDAVEWEMYTQSIVEDANQFASAVSGSSPQMIVLFTRPEVNRALLVYLRTCYSPPRLP